MHPIFDNVLRRISILTLSNAPVISEKEPLISQVPWTDLISYIKTNLFESTKNYIEIEGQIKGKNYFKLFYKRTKHPWWFGKRLKRDLISTINRCRSGHYNLNSSLFKIKIVDNSSCTCGAPEQDLNHIINHCPLLHSQRKLLETKLLKLKQYLPLNINKILSELDISVITTVHSFLKSCKLNI